MTETQLLIGSLSNDLFRVASLTQRGSTKAALKFLQEAKRWSVPLQKQDVAEYIIKIAQDVSACNPNDDISMADAERYLMNGVLLQNYVLHAH
ncbi:MAG TPA: hypothetical protein DEP87_03565 [Candidatus Pacebacteria bacterium]|nr:hypothetical protein [Candidatus Paceibacterota bacterium]